METVAAVCVSKKELFNGVRLSEFQYKYKYNGKKKLYEQDSFNIIMEDHDLLLVWTVKRYYSSIRDKQKRNFDSCQWSYITLEKCEKLIYGNYVIEGQNDKCVDGHKNADKFDSNSLPLKKWIIPGVYSIANNVSCITFTVQVYHEDGRVSSAVQDYSDFLTNKNLCDVTFVIGDEKFSAHKLILSARSNIFAKMFEVEMLEKNTGEVKIPDIEPAVFKLLLDFIYTSKLDSNDPKKIFKLLKAAHGYSLKSLVQICEYRLSYNLNVDNVVDVLITADLMELNFLKKDCMKFMNKNKNKEYTKMLKAHENLQMELLELMMKSS